MYVWFYEQIPSKQPILECFLGNILTLLRLIWGYRIPVDSLVGNITWITCVCVSVEGLPQNTTLDMSLTCWKKLKNWIVKKSTSKYSLLFFMHALWSPCADELEKALQVRSAIFFAGYEKIPHNSIPFLWNLLDILRFLLKFTDIYQHFWHFNVMSPTSPTK